MSVATLVGVALAGIVTGLALTAATAVRLIRVTRQPELARLPVAPATDVTFDAPGPVELAIEGPLFAARLRALAFVLADATGTSLRLDPLWMRTSSGGLSRTRLSLHRTAIPRPGRYTLTITGIDAAADYRRCAVVFVHPAGPGLALTIVALLASIGLTAASVATVGALLFRPGSDGPIARTPDAPSPSRSAPPPLPEGHGGRSLATDSRRLSNAQDVVWPSLQLHLRVPTGWATRTLTATELDLRHPAMPSTFVVGRVNPLPAGPTVAEYLTAHLEHLREQLEAGRIDGYATRRIDGIPGVLEIGRHGDGRAITWTGFAPADAGAVSVTLVAGAADPDFARDEGLLGAIVESARFE